MQGYYLVNKDDGGKGTNPWLNKTNEEKEQTKDKISEKLKELFKDKENHPSYGNKRPDNADRMKNFRGENHWSHGKHRPKHSERMSGKNNPFFGNTSHKGKNNPRARKIIVLNKNNETVKKYNFIKEMLEDSWIKQFPSPNNRVYIFKCLKNGLEFHGYKLIYEEE